MAEVSTGHVRQVAAVEVGGAGVVEGLVVVHYRQGETFWVVPDGHAEQHHLDHRQSNHKQNDSGTNVLKY